MKALTCAATRRRLHAFHDGELTVSDQIAVAAHLDWCDSCARALDDFQLIGVALRRATSGRGPFSGRRSGQLAGGGRRPHEGRAHRLVGVTDAADVRRPASGVCRSRGGRGGARLRRRHARDDALRDQRASRLVGGARGSAHARIEPESGRRARPRADAEAARSRRSRPAHRPTGMAMPRLRWQRSSRAKGASPISSCCTQSASRNSCPAPTKPESLPICSMPCPARDSSRPASPGCRSR